MDRFRAPPRCLPRARRAGAATAVLIALGGTAALAQVPVAKGVPPVLPEGSELLSMKGYFARSLRDPGLLVFRTEASLAGGAQRTFVLLPCDPVEDGRRLMEDPGTGATCRFEVSGTVYAYQRRAFLLATSLVALPMPVPPGMLAAVAPPGLEPPPPPPQDPLPPRLDAYASEVAARLAASPVLDTPVPSPSAPGEDDGSSLDDGLAERLERRLDGGIAAAGASVGGKRPTPAGERAIAITSGERFQDRRASVLRDPVTGAWRARFDTGRAGDGPHDGAEASLEILPCTALEALSRSVRQAPIGSAWLLSGEVVSAGKRHYLLLTRAKAQAKHKFLSR